MEILPRAPSSFYNPPTEDFNKDVNIDVFLPAKSEANFPAPTQAINMDTRSLSWPPRALSRYLYGGPIQTLDQWSLQGVL